MTATGRDTVDAPRLPARLMPDWQGLTRPTVPAHPFDPTMVEHLPEPARRWLRHAIRPGTPLRRSAVLRQHGEIRLGAWRRFEAVQALAPLDGFIWAATTHLYGLPVHGFDRYRHGTGQLRHRLLDLVTVASATGPDVSRSAAARHTGEIVWVPAAALAPEVGWQAVDDDHVALRIPCGDRVCEPTLTVSASGAVTRVTIPRWTNVGGAPWREEPFTALLHDERTFDGYTVPVHATAGWGYGTDRWDDGGAFIRQVIDSVRHL